MTCSVAGHASWGLEVTKCELRDLACVAVTVNVIEEARVAVNCALSRIVIKGC